MMNVFADLSLYWWHEDEHERRSFLQILMNLNDDESKLNYDRWTHSWYFYVLKIFWEVYNPFSVWFFVWYELILFYLCLYDLLWSIVYDLVWIICSFSAMTESEMYQLWGWDIARMDNLEPCEYTYLRIFSLEKKLINLRPLYSLVWDLYCWDGMIFI